MLWCDSRSGRSRRRSRCRLRDVAVGAGPRLFELTKKAPEYGAVDLRRVGQNRAARRDAVGDGDRGKTKRRRSSRSRSIQKFAQTVGQAAEGSDKAAKSLTALGLDPKKAAEDLDGALAKVFKRIADARSPVEANTLAFQAFGKQGKELIPFIKEFDGDLAGLTKKLEEMGIIIGDKDAIAAHEFHGQLVLLESQIGAVATKLGIALIPAFSRLDEQLTHFLSSHQGEIVTFINAFAYGFEKVVSGAEATVNALERYYAGYKSFMEGLGLGFLVPKPFLLNGLISDYKADYANHAHESAGLAPSVPGGDYPDVYGKKGAAEKFKLSPDGKALVDAANKIGISPLDLATIIGFETAGTYSTSKTNSVGRFGLIQFGSGEASQYGASKGQSFSAQLDAVVKYLVDRFSKRRH
jgi:hypothetical protein